MSEKNLHEVQNDEMSDVVELIDDTGRVLKFYHIGTIEHKGGWYVFFQPAEKIEGTEEDEVVIFSLTQDDKNQDVLAPIEDEALLEEVYEEFCRQMEEDEDGEEAEEQEGGCDCSNCSKGCKH